MKYIDADKLVAEIKAWRNKQMGFAWDAVNEVLEIIDSLQQEQPDVDVEKTLDEYYKNADFGPSEAIEYEVHKDIARHFYELGRLNVRKEK